jgi:DNA-binding MarR family transcriptional regulator
MDEALAGHLVALVQQMLLQFRASSLEDWSALELTMPQLRTLLLLEGGPRRMSEIATYLGSALPSATTMVDRLVAKHLVERVADPTDRRVVTCRLTEQGRAEITRVWHVSQARVLQVANTLTPDELETVLRALEILHEATARQSDAQANSPAGAGAEG